MIHRDCVSREAPAERSLSIFKLEKPLQRIQQSVMRTVLRRMAERIQRRVQHFVHQPIGELLDFLRECSRRAQVACGTASPAQLASARASPSETADHRGVRSVRGRCTKRAVSCATILSAAGISSARAA